MGFIIMRRSRLEMNVDILEALACHGKLKLTHIMYKAKINCSVLKECLDLLIRYNLVEEQILQKKRHETRIIYAITERGLTALKNAMEINNAIPIIEDADIPSIAMLSSQKNNTLSFLGRVCRN